MEQWWRATTRTKSSVQQSDDDLFDKPEEVFRSLMPAVEEPAVSSADHDPVCVTSLCGDGSDRRFYRIRRGASRYVLLISPRRNGAGIDENDSYLLIGKHLFCRGIPVPRILAAEPRRGCFLIEDVGDYHLQLGAKRPAWNIGVLYERCIGLLVQVHRKVPSGFEEDFCFDTPLYDPLFVYRRELEYFREAFLVKTIGLEISREDLHSDFEHLAEEAGVRERKMVIHRDFQSRNIMIHRGRLRLLDFQGMRFGPPAYDLASLLVDPYVSLPLWLQDGLARLYWDSAKSFLGVTRAQFMQSYASTRLCRNLQILGAYGFLGIVKGKRQFLQYIPKALEHLCVWLDGPCRNRFPALRRTLDMIRSGAKCFA